jgi:hypothetical protein
MDTFYAAKQGCAKIYCIDNILQHIVHNTGSKILQYNILIGEDIAIQYIDGSGYCNKYIVDWRYCNAIY